MKKTIFTLGGVILVLALIILTGCSRTSSSGTGAQVIRVVTILGSPELMKITNSVVASIEKRNPGLKIQLDVIPFGDYQQKLTTAFAANDAPDVIFVEVNNFVDLYLRGALEDLLPYIQKDGIDLKMYYPDVMGRFTHDGHVLVLPQDTAPAGLMYYNKKIFREAGVPYPTSDWSWPEPFLSICKKLVKDDAQGRRIRWAYDEAYPISTDNFMFSNGGNFVDNTAHPTRFTMDDPRVIQAVRFRYDMIKKYHVAPSPTEIQSFSAANSVENMFINGSIAMMCSGIWHTPVFLQAKDLDFDVVSFPSGPTGLRGWMSGGSGFAMNKNCKNKELAWKIIKEFTCPETLTQNASTGMIQPSIISLAQSDVFLKAPGPAHKAVLLDMWKYSHYQPFMSNWGEIMGSNFAPAMDKVWLGDRTPEEVLPEVSKIINQKYFKSKP